MRARLCRAALKTQARVIHALIIRETRTRFGDSRLGYGWALIEPILHITAAVAVFFALLMHGQAADRHPVLRFLLYRSDALPRLRPHQQQYDHGVTSNGSLLQLPLVSTFDVILARGLLEFVTDLSWR